MTYIHFTEEQKYRASCVDLVEFLRRQGEKLIRSGPEYRMASDHSVTVRGNEWYDHASKEGGGPISFVQNYCGLSYPEAVTRLLDGEQGRICEPAPKKKEPKKEFIQPPVGREMRRLYAYLLKKRLIDREVLSTFVRAGLVYEDEKYHNAVFIGKDEHGVVRHAHKRSTSDMGKTFRINVESSDPRYSFHWNGTSDRLYVFEAPIDLLSFLTLYPKDWQQHSYPWTGTVICGQCGSIFKRKKCRESAYWTCRLHDKSPDKCQITQIPESEFERAFLRLYYKLRHHGMPVLSQLLTDLQTAQNRKLLWSLDIVELNKQIADIVRQERLLAELKQQGLVDPDIYITRSNTLAEQLRTAKLEKERFLESEEDQTIRQTQVLLEILETGPEFLEAFDEELFSELVAKIIVENNECLRFRLINGLELTETIERTVR